MKDEFAIRLVDLYTSLKTALGSGDLTLWLDDMGWVFRWTTTIGDQRVGWQRVVTMDVLSTASTGDIGKHLAEEIRSSVCFAGKQASVIRSA